MCFRTWLVDCDSQSSGSWDITSAQHVRAVYGSSIYVWQIFIIEWAVLRSMAPTIKECWEVVKSLTTSLTVSSSVVISETSAREFHADSKRRSFAHVCQTSRFAPAMDKLQSAVSDTRISSEGWDRDCDCNIHVQVVVILSCCFLQCAGSVLVYLYLNIYAYICFYGI